MTTTAPYIEDQLVYVTHSAPTEHREDIEEQEDAIVVAVIRAIRRNPRLHAELVVALEHKV
jgi:hypothetical protein